MKDVDLLLDCGYVWVLERNLDSLGRVEYHGDLHRQIESRMKVSVRYMKGQVDDLYLMPLKMVSSRDA